MKQILITGKNSYIGNAFEDWISQWPDKYQITKLSVRDDRWRKEDWSQYDTVLHVAGIAHSSSNANMEELYYQVNRDLTYDIAKKAKNDGITHFINMSSIIVFGTKQEKINSVTKPNPDNFYGDSKLQGEKKINDLVNDNFKVAHIRPPMVYGSNSKGNFPLLANLAVKVPFFPDIDNKRSMIFIKNLTELLRLVIDNNTHGFIHPQNPEYIKTIDLVEYIAKANNHRIYKVKIFNTFINQLKAMNLINKVFGNLYYDKDMTDSNLNYKIYNLETSIHDIYQ
ncbi:NAD-dependent epimerase/dehydratase family protein [Aerococcus urinaeequi]|uniref:NAD-dependent epimerase/dehydratase family protein n=1 Tax=Aerococcus urinaeequi TaxID=51665 RepID=UPI003EDAD484